MTAKLLLVCAALLVCALAADRVPGIPGVQPDEIKCRLRNVVARDWALFRNNGPAWGAFANSICGANHGVLGYKGGRYDCSRLPDDFNLGSGTFDLSIVDANPAWAAKMSDFIEAVYDFATVQDAPACSFGGWAELQCPKRRAPWHNALGGKPIRGVNLGGWFLLEPWISGISIPWTATAIDEYTLTESLGKPAAAALMEQHWSTFYSAADFTQMKSYGLNTVRIPFGHWFFDTEEELRQQPYVRNVTYLQTAIQWACDADLKVILDLHGAMGSQNGFDNSGRTHPRNEPDDTQGRRWLWNDAYLASTVNVLRRVTEFYVAQNQRCQNIIAIEVLNEPWVDLDAGRINTFYNNAIVAIRAVATNVPIIISDSFRYNVWSNLRQYPPQEVNIQNRDVYLDAHIYQGFNGADVLTGPATHIAMACGFKGVIDWMSCYSYPTFVGEWSLTTNDCTPAINGWNRGSKWNACPGNINDDVYQTAWLRDYAIKQIHAWESHLGWFFWTFKVEGDGFDQSGTITPATMDRARWSFRKCQDMGYIPNFSNPTTEPLIQDACDNFPASTSARDWAHVQNVTHRGRRGEPVR